MTEMIVKTGGVVARTQVPCPFHHPTGMAVARPGMAPALRGSVADDRFQRLLGPAAWSALPPAVRCRFSRALATGHRRVFEGRVVMTKLTRAGAILARLARLVGGPLPDQDGATGPAVVLVTESPGLGGQIWTRTYARPGGFPQTINSVKRFAGPTWLEEYLGHGLVMRLTLGVETGALVFRSAGYDLAVAGLRLPIPRALTPGTCTITHRDLGSGRFAFELELTHPWAGLLVRQVAHFEEV